MPQNAFVTLKGGVVQAVEDYTSVQEQLLEDYSDGSTYRDLFQHGSMDSASAIEGASWYPAADGQAYVGGGNQDMKARLSDEIAHTAPRHLQVNHTRLRFFRQVEGIVEDMSMDTNVLHLDTGLSVSDKICFLLYQKLAGVLTLLPEASWPYTGLARGEIYTVIATAGSGVIVSTTEGGAEVNLGAGTPVSGLPSGATTELHFAALSTIADFKPGEWKVWSNAKPLRF